MLDKTTNNTCTVPRSPMHREMYSYYSYSSINNNMRELSLDMLKSAGGVSGGQMNLRKGHFLWDKDIKSRIVFSKTRLKGPQAVGSLFVCPSLRRIFHRSTLPRSPILVQGCSSRWRSETFSISTRDLWSSVRVNVGFLVTSLTKAPLPQLLNSFRQL